MGRHQAPGRRRRKSASDRAPEPAATTPPPAAPPQRQQPPTSWPPQPPQPLAAPRRPAPQPLAAPPQPPQPAPATAEQPGPRLATWWLMLETGALALLVAIVGVLVYAADIVVDGLEIIVGSGLLLAPILVRHLVLRVHRRWTALLVAYVALLVVAFTVLVVGDLVVLHTIAGFGAGSLGVLAAGAAFVFSSRLFAAKRHVQAPPADAPEMPARPVPPTAHAPVGAPIFHPSAPDESDTDTLPQVIPHNEEREDDSLAG